MILPTRRPPTAASAATAALLMAALAGCAVGPDFHRPPPPAAAASTPDYDEAPLPAQTASSPTFAGASQQFVANQDIPAEWWSLFHSPALDALVRMALAQSPTLASAQAALRNAQENYAAEAGAELPTVSGSLLAERERSTNASFGAAGASIFNLYNASVSVSYDVDAFGGRRRQLEGLAAAVENERFQIEATYLSLTANVVTTAIQEASLRAQIRATRDVLDAEEKAYDVVRQQFEVGAVAKSSVLQQQTQAAQTRATLPPLEKSLSQARHQLAAYAGRLPNEAGLAEFELGSLQLPGDLPVSLPSALVRQRPDIRAAEALLHEASAQVGVATANLYPQISLTGSFGSSATHVRDVFGSNTAAWSLAAGLTQPIFNGGTLQAQKRAAIATYDQSAAQYRSTVITAFQNVADSLRAVEIDARTLQEQANAESLAQATLDLENAQYRLGAVSYLSLLDAQRTYQQTRIALVQAQAARFSDTAALFQSLGGGWWTRPALADLSQPGTTAVTDTPALAP